MWTKEESAAYIQKKIDEESKSKFPALMAVQAGIYQSLYDNTYAEYIDLAQSCEKLIDELNKVAANLPIDIQIAMNSLYFSFAVQHLKKVNKSTIHEPA